MATSDLQNELIKPGFKVDSSSEKKLCTAILEQLEDVSGDISALAVKWCVSYTANFDFLHEYCLERRFALAHARPS